MKQNRYLSLFKFLFLNLLIYYYKEYLVTKRELESVNRFFEGFVKGIDQNTEKRSCVQLNSPIIYTKTRLQHKIVRTYYRFTKEFYFPTYLPETLKETMDWLKNADMFYTDFLNLAFQKDFKRFYGLIRNCLVVPAEKQKQYDDFVTLLDPMFIFYVEVLFKKRTEINSELTKVYSLFMNNHIEQAGQSYSQLIWKFFQFEKKVSDQTFLGLNNRKV